MLDNTYPIGTVRALLPTEHVTEATRRALTQRLERQPSPPRFFSAEEFATLTAVCARLIPQEFVDLAGVIDARLADGRTDGWRYDALPPDGEAYRENLAALAGCADLDQRLTDLQNTLWFGELLAEVCAAYYSHPLAQEQIGYVGMADRPGWTRIGLNELEQREPRRG